MGQQRASPPSLFRATRLGAPCLVFVEALNAIDGAAAGRSESVHARRIGQTLNGKWTLRALLGVGGMGAVYAATHRNGKSAAVKILHPELSTNPETVSRFVREGYIANAIGHPGVVAALDDDETEDGLYYLVMEHLEGLSLEQAQRERGAPFDVEEALALGRNVLDVMAAAHEQGIVHRDLKPDNVFLLAAGGVKLLDFGIAKLRAAPAGPNATLVGCVFGTPGFMPPEQARGRTELVDERADVWAIGAMLHFMLTGQRLHEAPTVNESLLRAMCEPAPPLSTILPSVPAAVAELVDRALAFDRDDRWSDAGAMLRQATLAASTLGAAAAQVGSDEPDLSAPDSRAPDSTLRSQPPVDGTEALAIGPRAEQHFLSTPTGWVESQRRARTNRVAHITVRAGLASLAVCVVLGIGVAVKRHGRSQSAAPAAPAVRIPALSSTGTAVPPPALSSVVAAPHEGAAPPPASRTARHAHQLGRLPAARPSPRAARPPAVTPTAAPRAPEPRVLDPLRSRQ